jgi:glutaminyl-tRNA synthetase
VLICGTSLADVKSNDKFQFQRLGYFNVDRDLNCYKISSTNCWIKDKLKEKKKKAKKKLENLLMNT